MSEMKSALERAMERAESLGDPTPEERLRFEIVPKGEIAASDYLKGKGDLGSVVEACSPDATPYFVEGALQVLVYNLRLARTDQEEQQNGRAFDGIRILGTDKNAIDQIASQIAQISTMYRQAYEPNVQQAREQTRQKFEQALEEAAKTNPNLVPSNINVEAIPEFQQEWAKAVSQVTAQYQDALDQQRAQLTAIT